RPPAAGARPAPKSTPHPPRAPAGPTSPWPVGRCPAGRVRRTSGSALAPDPGDTETEGTVAGIGEQPAGQLQRAHVITVQTVQGQPGRTHLARVGVAAHARGLPRRQTTPVGDVDLVEQRHRGAVAEAPVGHDLEDAGHLMHLDERADLLVALADQRTDLVLAVLLAASGWRVEILPSLGDHVVH